jgi:hypothetical protein
MLTQNAGAHAKLNEFLDACFFLHQVSVLHNVRHGHSLYSVVTGRVCILEEFVSCPCYMHVTYSLPEATLCYPREFSIVALSLCQLF